MITDQAFLGSGVYASVDQYGTLTLDYGGPGTAGVILNRDTIVSLLAFLKVKPLYDITPLRKALREELEAQEV